ncbi:hypothetical protein B0H13DRAFT_2280244 [Mycena leptocephala]|nr:hypothetical protein B0H13DRAFT_2280244 [Mycena leptocephala]
MSIPMEAIRNGGILGRMKVGDDPSEEAAASKLWAVYVSEAEKYDRSLVDSWKSDMEGMLIFLLSQISQQLAAAANGSTFQTSTPAHFVPSASSLVCNALWFISLGLSLTCALIATLLEQWARDFLHKADMRSASAIRGDDDGSNVSTGDGSVASTRRPDYRALVWTVKSLADDAELEPFVEGLHDVLWGPGHIQDLLRNPDLQLLSRIESLLHSCSSGLLSVEASRRRKITCFKALWAIASLQTPGVLTHPEPLNFFGLSDNWDQTDEDKDMFHYSISATALTKWSTFLSLQGPMMALAQSLEADVKSHPDLPAEVDAEAFSHWYVERLQQYASGSKLPEAVNVSGLVAAFVQTAKGFCAKTHGILFHYLVWSAKLETAPHRYTDTEAAISFECPSSAMQHDLQWALSNATQPFPVDKWDTSNVAWIDVVIGRQGCFPPQFWVHIFEAFPITLLNGPSDVLGSTAVDGLAPDDVLTALWHVSFLSIGSWSSASEHYQPILEVSLLPHKTALLPDSLTGVDFGISQNNLFNSRILEARLIQLADFIDGFTSNFTLYKATETFNHITSNWCTYAQTTIHEDHQRRIAESMYRVLKCDNLHAVELLEITAKSFIFNVYEQSGVWGQRSNGVRVRGSRTRPHDVK